MIVIQGNQIEPDSTFSQQLEGWPYAKPSKLAREDFLTRVTHAHPATGQPAGADYETTCTDFMLHFFTCDKAPTIQYKQSPGLCLIFL